MIKRFLWVLTVLACTVIGLPANAQNAKELIFGNAKAEALVKEGNVLWSQQKPNQALEKFREASIADPKASAPWSSQASVFYAATKFTKPEYVEEYRARAKALAEKALQLNSEDPTASEVLRSLMAPSAETHDTNNQDAAHLFSEAEELFQRHDFKAALLKYEAAAALDPGFAKAVLYAGDANFQLQNYDRAEQLYRKSLDIDPRNFQAWRFLAHAQEKLNRPIEMIKFSLMKALEIQPNYMPAWDWYEAVSGADGVRLKKINVKRYANVRQDNDGGKISYQLEMSDTLKQTEKQEDTAVWLYYGVAKIKNLEQQKALNDSARPASKNNSFKVERDAWHQVFNDPQFTPTLTNPLLVALQQANKDNQLDAAVFLFFFDDSFRSDFEEWKKHNPLALQKFVERYALRPSYANK